MLNALMTHISLLPFHSTAAKDGVLADIYRPLVGAHSLHDYVRHTNRMPVCVPLPLSPRCMPHGANGHGVHIAEGRPLTIGQS